MLVVVELHVVPPCLFALVHAAMRHGLRGAIAFFAICLLVGGTVENFGVLTGFPFGHYRPSLLRRLSGWKPPAVTSASGAGDNFDPTGAQWQVASITAATALVSIFVMGAFTLIAWVQPTDRKRNARLFGEPASRYFSNRMDDSAP
jgi:hypothetical protein